MAEKDTLFSSKVKYGGIFNFAGFYGFCYEWLKDEIGLNLSEEAYSEKLKGDSKDIDIAWNGTRKVTDYFKFQVQVKFRILGMKQVEVQQNGAKIKTNDGSVEVKVKGTLIKDHTGRFENNGFEKTLRGFYEKWIIKSRVDEMEDKLIGDCDEFLQQAKAWLDLEGKH